MKKLVSIYGVLLLVACAWAQDVRYNYDDQADFSQYRTYRWVQHPDSVNVDQITRNQLGAALNAELAKKGLTETESEDADLVLVYQIALQQEKQITSYNSGWGYGPGWGGGWYGGMGGSGISTTTTNTITVGAFALDMYDAAKKQLVWRGVATKTIDERAKPDKVKKNMEKSANKLMKNYPPKKKK